MNFTYRPIGKFCTPYQTLKSIPKAYGKPPSAEATIEIAPDYAEGLLDIASFTHLIVIFAFDKSVTHLLQVTPPGQTQKRGVFATRSPTRPNPIGLLTLELLRREGLRLFVRGVDVLNGTPVLDIKPYLPHYDSRPEAGPGWAEKS